MHFYRKDQLFELEFCGDFVFGSRNDYVSAAQKENDSI